MRRTWLPGTALAVVVLVAGTHAARGADTSSKVDPWVLDTASRGNTEFLIMLREQADLRGAASLHAKTAKGAFVQNALASLAERTQAPLLRLLEERGVPHRSLWIANMIWVRGDARLVAELAAREDVFHVYANPTVHFQDPVDRSGARLPQSPEGIEWNITKVHAPDVWALGFTGQNVVVGGQDTGYQWDHPAIKGKYRGWNGTMADHNYNWHDSIHSGGGSCGHDATAPCDDTDHGTHTMGTMVGDDGGSNQIGMAPGAKWIGCRNMDQGAGTPTTYSECFEWFIAPTDLNDQNPDPTKAPHVINNSWGCPPSEGCTDPNVLKTVVENTRAAGIEVVVSAGNSGSGCNSVDSPAAIYEASFTIGATDISDVIANFSSRGAVTIDGSMRLKPDVSAPGVNVRSSVPFNSYASFSGTSMAGPHVVGLVALLLSAEPSLIGNPDAIEPIIEGSAVPRTSGQTCNGTPGSSIPNNTYGWGRVDALAAVDASAADLAVAQTDSPDPTIPTVNVTYTLTVTNNGPITANDVTLDDAMPGGTSFVSATPSQGTCGHTGLDAECSLGTLDAGASATVTLVVTPGGAGSMTNIGTVTADEADPNLANNVSNETTTVDACPLPTPLISAPISVPSQTAGLVASIEQDASLLPTWAVDGGTLTDGQSTDAITFTSGDPGTTMNVRVSVELLGCASEEASQLVSVDFLDVPPEHPFHNQVNTIARNRITAGCQDGKSFCPDSPNTRAEMSVFLLKAKYGADHVPPPATGTVFDDVPIDYWAAAWIEELASLHVTGGCTLTSYCPDAPVSRAEMAVFLLKTLLGSDYVPPACAGLFGDVACTPGTGFPDWIEDLYNRHVTGGCQADPLLYCPDQPNTRGQMAVFLTLTFGLQ
jgi:serine protease AprX